ncbi:hypothetical protein Y1Q_0019964 [Alligator mississippiensis]|uniref:Uncharacterized protein n=1 Tax=Alligator mississippiensis TaxID=8496 RepID=A0A151PDX9_ALLMI|nr:hypothetical protein Y1Q_0019964 [Alligator mississippiensis]
MFLAVGSQRDTRGRYLTEEESLWSLPEALSDPEKHPEFGEQQCLEAFSEILDQLYKTPLRYGHSRQLLVQAEVFQHPRIQWFLSTYQQF